MAKWKLFSILPAVLAVSVIVLTLALLMGAFQSVKRSNLAIKEIDRVHFPVIEELAVSSRLQQSLDFLLKISALSGGQSYTGEYELARELLIETIYRVNETIQLNKKVLGRTEAIDRTALSEYEKQILKYMAIQQYHKLNGIINSEEYIELKAQFAEQLFSAVQEVTNERQTKLEFLQNRLQREYLIGGGITGALSLILIVLGVSWSHSNRKRLELESLAQHSARLAALGEMAGGVAHEINNPLAIIDGSLDMCLRDINRNRMDAEKLKVRIEKARNTLKRITNIVKGLRTFSREPDQDELKLCVLERVISDSLDLSRERLKHMGIRLDVEVQSHLEALCNITEISQVLINLVNNSIDEIKESEDPWIRIEGIQKLDSVVISVVDSGRGISAELASEIMRPFFTTKAIGEGTGLGLSISHGILKKHGGDLKIDHTNKNTKFDLILPLAKNARTVA